MESTLNAYRPMPQQMFIAREGYPFLAAALAASFTLWLTGLAVGSALMLFVAGFVAYFFRNPERAIPEGEGLVVSPADGRVIAVISGARAPGSEAQATKVSIFMSVMNVHINRLPVAGRVKRVAYTAGKFLVASLDKASEHNERNAIQIEDEGGREILMVQIAGLVARRIVCYLREGDVRSRGDRVGLIRFGSRVDLYLPPEVDVSVRKGEKVRGGETVIGRYR